MNLHKEDTAAQIIEVPVEWVRFLMRLRQMSAGRRYQITLEIDPKLGPSWSVIELGKIERGARLNRA